MIVLKYQQGDTFTLYNNDTGERIHVAIGREAAKGIRIAVEMPRHIELLRDTLEAKEALGENFK
jgi:sRNA-binding carbon storage regulator CsrA